MKDGFKNKYKVTYKHCYMYIWSYQIAKWRASHIAGRWALNMSMVYMTSRDGPCSWWIAPVNIQAALNTCPLEIPWCIILHRPMAYDAWCSVQCPLQ